MDSPPTDSLTQRQRECLRLVGSGFTRKEIAQRLGLSPETVKDHIDAARARLGGVRASEAARLLVAREEGTPPDRGPPSKGIAEPAQASILPPPTEAGLAPPGFGVGEVRSVYEIAPPAPQEPVVRQLARTIWRRRNDLTMFEQIAAGLLSAFFAAALVGALIVLQRAIS